MPNLIKSVDVSSNNPTRTLAQVNEWISQGCQLLIVHSYHSFEANGLSQTTTEWIELARQAGLWCLPYVWLFRFPADTERQTTDAIANFRNAGEDPKLIMLDCETYRDKNGNITDAGPTAWQILIACTTARSLGVEPILYSNAGWLAAIDGNVQILRGVPAWIANFNGDPSLNVPAPDWVSVLGHQYTETPEDWSVFDLDALTLLAGQQAAPDPCQDWIARMEDYKARNAAREAQIDAARAYVAGAPRVKRKDLINLLSRSGFLTPAPSST